MKLKKLALVMGAVLAVPVANADVATTDYPIHDVTLHLSSATALRETFSRLASRLANPAFPRNIYRAGNTSAANNFRVYEFTFHTPVSSPGATGVGNLLAAKGLSGKRVLVYHTVDVTSTLGGSIVGVLPIYRGIPMEFATPTLDGAPGGCPVGPFAVDPVTGFDLHDCSTVKHAKRPYVGASDTEVKSFTSINLAGADVVVTPAIPSLATAGLVGKWKAPVTDKEFNLSVSQPLFAVGFGIAATKAAITAGLNNLDHSHVSSLLAGTVPVWDFIKPKNLAGNPTNLTGQVTICRRTQGSGTQASFNALFHLNPGLDPVGASLPVAEQQNIPGPFFDPDALSVIASSSTSGVKTCLVNAQAAGKKAIGILSLENNEVSPDWEFIALNGRKVFENPEVSIADGVADRIREDLIADGSYPYYQEAAIQWYKTGLINGVTVGVCVDDPESAVLNDAPHVAIAAPPAAPCHAGELYLPPTSSDGSTGVVPTGDVLRVAELIRDEAGNPILAKNVVLTQNLPGILALPKWWNELSPDGVNLYNSFRFGPDELKQGINNFTRDGLSSKPSAFAP